MQLGQLVNREFGLLKGGADNLVTHPVIGQILHQDDEVVAIKFGEIGLRANRRGQRVQFGEVAHLPFVEIEVHGDLPVGRVLRRVLGDEGSWRACERP